MTINNMHYSWQHPHMFHNTNTQAQWWEDRGGRWGANRSQTMTRWHLSEDGGLNPPGDLSLKLSGISPHSMSESVRRPVNLLRGTTHGITQTSIWPTSGCWSICAQGNKGEPCEGMRGKTKLNCHRVEHELPPFRLHCKGGICINQKHFRNIWT